MLHGRIRKGKDVRKTNEDKYSIINIEQLNNFIIFVFFKSLI